jgi:hypothetical protein
MTRIDALNASVPLTHESGLLGPERALGRYLDVSAKLGDGSDAAGLITDAWVRIYYDQAELDLNHDGDCIDPGDVNESSLCLYWLSESGAWLKVGATNGEEIGVEMQDTSAAGKGYGGFAWANVSHLSLFALAGTLNSIPKAPSAPRDLAIEVRGARATISWNPPSDDGGDGIVSYAIYRNGSLLANTSSPGFIDDSIQEGASYAYQVRAYNHVGQGAASEATVNVPVSSSHMAMALLIIVGVSLIGIISFLTVNRRRP